MHSWEDFLKLGEANPTEPTPPKASDPATIMYTSGTTGAPCFHVLIAGLQQLCYAEYTANVVKGENS